MICRRPISCRAFTIIELMVALAALLALSAIVVPMSASWVRHALQAEVPDQIEGALWSARALAGQRNAPVVLTAETSASGVRLWASSSAPISPSEDQVERSARLPLADLSQVALRSTPERREGEAAQADTATSEAVVRIAVLMPDGTAMVDPSLRLAVAERSSKVVIDPFALTVVLVPLASDAPDSPEAPAP